MRLTDRPWVQELLARESFTATEASQMSRAAGETRHALSNELMGELRRCKQLEVVTVGYAPGSKTTRFYRLRRRES